jgi:hypothetical protein
MATTQTVKAPPHAGAAAFEESIRMYGEEIARREQLCGLLEALFGAELDAEDAAAAAEQLAA